MRKFLLTIACLLTVLLQAAGQQLDSAKVRAVDSLLTRYLDAIGTEPLRVKTEECDFMVSACTDSLLRQYTAVRLYEHFFSSDLMGDDAVAIHLYDKWFAPKKVRMYSEIDELNAGIFAEFNRQTLIGCPAPAMEMTGRNGEKIIIPGKGAYSVLFFYDTDCKTCQAESELLNAFLGKGLFELDFYAIYISDDRESWDEFIDEKWTLDCPEVRVTHLWDPQQETDFLRAYGLIQTPRLFLVAPDGRVVGRGLNTEALVQLLIAYLN